MSGALFKLIKMIKLILWEKIGKRKKLKIILQFLLLHLFIFPRPHEDLPDEVISYRQLDFGGVNDIIIRQYPELKDKLQFGSRIYEIFDKYNLHTVYTDYKKYLELQKLDLSYELLRLNSKYQIITDNDSI